MPLTDTWLKANHGKPRESTHTEADRDGMSARVTPKGKIVFQLRFRVQGKAARLDLGTYPYMSLKQAREAAAKNRAMLDEGRDPRIEKRLERDQLASSLTVEQLIRQWHVSYCVGAKESAEQILRSFELHIFPTLGSLPADRVSVSQWMTRLEEITRQYPSIADRLMINAKQALNWAEKRELIPKNVLARYSSHIDLGITKNEGERTLESYEMREIWLAVLGSRIAPLRRIFYAMAVLSGARGAELRLAERQHFDLKKRVWITPPENHKTGRKSKKPIIRPITDGMLSLYHQAAALSDNPFLFGDNGKVEPMPRSFLTESPYNMRQWLRRHHGIEQEHWSFHDLRRTMRTNLSPITQPHIAEMMIGHVLPRTWRTYDKHDYLAEATEAYDKWQAVLVQMINHDPFF